MSNTCTCGTAAEARKLLGGRVAVPDLAELVVHDGITCGGTPEWLGSFLAQWPSLGRTDRTAGLRLLWELTVDPAVPAALGRKGLTVDPPVLEGPCGSPTDNARACREVVAPALEVIAPPGDADAGELDGWAVLQSALDVRPGPEDHVLAMAVLAGTYERRDLVPWFASRSTVAAAIGLRNAGFPDPPPPSAVRVLAAEAVAPTLDLSPWIRHNEAVGTYGRLLLDWPSAHREVVVAALASSDPDVRHEGVGEAGRGLRCWRGNGPALVPLLIPAVEDADPDVAEQAVVELSQLPHAAADVLLTVVLEPSRSRRARANALRALARDGDPRCLPPLLAELRSPALIADVSSAVLGMRRFADQIVPAIGDYLRGPNARAVWPRTRSVISAVSGWPESAELTGELTAFLDGEARSEALFALGELGAPIPLSAGGGAAEAWARWRSGGDIEAALAVLEDLLSGDPPGRRAAALCVMRMGPAASELQKPLQRLTEGELETAVAACAALAATGHPESAPPGVLAAALRARQDVDLVLGALEAGAGRGSGVEELVRTLAEDRVRFTWPAGEITDDERWQARARHGL
jgi:HEAT repeat protein